MIRAPLDLAVTAFGIQPQGKPATEPGICVATGLPIAVGDLVVPLKVGDTFMDARYLEATPGKKPFIHAACEPFFRKDVLIYTQYVLLTAKAAYPIRKRLNRAWFLLNPPEPPFAVWFSNTKMQHLIWRTPLTWDIDHWYLQIASRTLLIRRKVVLQARDMVTRMGELHIKEKGRPFHSLWEGEYDPGMTSQSNGQVTRYARNFAKSVGMERELDFIAALPPGDIWGLTSLVFQGGGAEMPSPINLEEKREALRQRKEAEALAEV